MYLRGHVRSWEACAICLLVVSVILLLQRLSVPSGNQVLYFAREQPPRSHQGHKAGVWPTGI